MVTAIVRVAGLRLWIIATVVWIVRLRLWIVATIVRVKGLWCVVSGLLKSLPNSGENGSRNNLLLSFASAGIQTVDLKAGSHSLKDAASNLLSTGSACVISIARVAVVVVPAVPVIVTVLSVSRHAERAGQSGDYACGDEC